MSDVLVLGAGVAGLSAALAAARAGFSVTLLTKAPLGASATRYAQGGVAAALTPPDSPELHFSDTLSAGGGLCDTDALRVLCAEGPARLRELISLGANFDSEGGALALAREGGHSLARVVHAGGDATGAEVERALVAAVRAAGVDVAEGWLALDLTVAGGRATGVSIRSPQGGRVGITARHVVLASGGAGQLFSVTTNPLLSTGDGVAMSLRAGVAVADVEFMQFHPTALHDPGMPRPLLSEALRGEGAVLRDEAGVAFMAGEHPLGDLAPRDVVARAIATRLAERNLDHLWLDATAIDGFPARFPTIWAACQAVGLDPTRDWLPVAPAAHYLCGGVVTDLDGATSLPGLWACGEVACTGVHGANRLASNSLLEGLVFGHRVMAAIAAGKDGADQTGAMRGVPAYEDVVSANWLTSAPHTGAQVSQLEADGLRERLQRTMTLYAGVRREAAGLAVAARELAGIEAAAGDPEVRNLAVVGGALVAAAADREESRGAHHRLDFPAPGPVLERIVQVGGERIRVPSATSAPVSPR
ncbi:MAG: L-aspartate oxidase [Acidimicrobiia bacterium]